MYMWTRANATPTSKLATTATTLFSLPTPTWKLWHCDCYIFSNLFKFVKFLCLVYVWWSFIKWNVGSDPLLYSQNCWLLNVCGQQMFVTIISCLSLYIKYYYNMAKRSGSKWDERPSMSMAKIKCLIIYHKFPFPMSTYK